MKISVSDSGVFSIRSVDGKFFGSVGKRRGGNHGGLTLHVAEMRIGKHSIFGAGASKSDAIALVAQRAGVR